MYSVVINSDKCSYLPTRSYPNLVTFKKHEKKYNKVSPHTRNDNGQTINIKERALKIQDNTNATNTTTNNMVSNRKRSNATAIHKEESNAKKAMLNPSESGYFQSSDTLSSISNDHVEGSDFGDRFLESITADDSFATPTAGNIDSINTNFNYSAGPIVISDDNVTFSSWGDDYMNDTLAGN